MATTLHFWDEESERNLTEALDTWQKAFNTPLNKFTEDNDLNWYGFDVIEDLKNSQQQWNYHVNETPAKIVWSPNASIPDKINVIAVYSDWNFKRDEPAGSTLFLFALYNGLPMILTSMQNQGNELMNFYYTETKSTSLYTIFHEITLR